MLELADIDVHYRGIQALRGVGLSIAAGEVHALIGPNGAGKSSLLNAISGLVPASGTMRFEGVSIAGMSAHRRARAGIIQVPEGRKVIAPLTVLENLELGRHAAGIRGSDASDLERVYAMFPVLAERRGQLSGSLSGGQQQMLAIGRALMGRPRLLLLDEPSLGLAPVITQGVFKALLELNRHGLTILLVEQNARLALASAHAAAVLEQGRIVRRGTGPELLHDASIADHYFGRASHEFQPQETP